VALVPVLVLIVIAPFAASVEAESSNVHLLSYADSTEPQSIRRESKGRASRLEVD
jgi:hypothetical protein